MCVVSHTEWREGTTGESGGGSSSAVKIGAISFISKQKKDDLTVKCTYIYDRNSKCGNQLIFIMKMLPSGNIFLKSSFESKRIKA